MDGSSYCNFCGKKLTAPEKKKAVKSRGNGQGSAYKRGSTWTAIITYGRIEQEDKTKPKKLVRKTKGGFPTKKAALEYCQELKLKGNNPKQMTLQQVWNAWSAMYAPRIGASTLEGYKYAYNHFADLHGSYMEEISSDDLQSCMDKCPSGKRTHQNMKCIAGLLWGYAFDKNIVQKDITSNLYTGDGISVQREPIEQHEVKAIKESIGKVRYAEYVFAMCYLGFRPGELLELRKDMLHCAMLPAEEGEEQTPVWYFVNGKKTAAGRDRVVVVPDQILDIVLERLFIPGTDLVFPMYHFNRKKLPTLVCFKPMSHEYFNKHVFKPLMQALGFDARKVPYCARHTYADLLKKAPGTDKDKAAMIGHSKYLFTVDHYQSSHLQDLKVITDAFK